MVKTVTEISGFEVTFLLGPDRYAYHVRDIQKINLTAYQSPVKSRIIFTDGIEFIFNKDEESLLHEIREVWSSYLRSSNHLTDCPETR